MTKARDPVCSMTVETERAPAHGRYGGVAVYFCSVACQHRYEVDHPPDR